MSYLAKVQNFFLKNDPERYYLAKRITRKFRNDEDAVMARLEEIYAKGGPKKLKVKDLNNPEPLLESSSYSAPPKKSKKKLFIIASIILALGGVIGFYLTIGSEDIHDQESHSSVNHVSDSTHNENSHQPEKTIEEIEDEIDKAEKDSVAEDIIDAAESIQLIR